MSFNNQESCSCKKKIELAKNDFDLVFECTEPTEQACWDNFSKLCTWGSVQVWEQIKHSPLVTFLHNTVTEGEHMQDLHESDFDDSLELQNVDDALRNLQDNYSDIESMSSGSEKECPNVETDDTLGLADNDNDEDDHESEGNLDSLIENIPCTVKYDQDTVTGYDLETSFGNMSLDTASDDKATELTNSSSDTQEISKASYNNILGTFGFQKFIVPSLLCRHPPPATGRDDDISKLREIMDDVLIKTDRIAQNSDSMDRILFGPDNKIGTNLLQLVREPKYKHFLPEFPLLHLRKSKINTLFSAYKSCGLLQILMFMCDDSDKKEWTKLISLEHIDIATRYVRRLSLSFHLAFVCKFLQTLSAADATEILDSLEEGDVGNVSDKWDSQFKMFLERGVFQNATFALHFDMMQHCDEVVAVALSERLGGPGGYHLLLSAVKSSLKFSFLNGATSYGPYCARLLVEHYSSGYFHQRMKETLYSTPIGDSTTNFACDSKREMDHKDALRSFRSGSNMAAVTRRMSLVDPLNETHQQRLNDRSKSEKKDAIENDENHFLKWRITSTDLKYILPTAGLILRRNGLSMEENHIPANTYTPEQNYVTPSVLDHTTKGVGTFLLKKYLSSNNLIGFTPEDIPDLLSNIEGPKSLVSRAKRSKGVTLKRTTEKAPVTIRSEREMTEQLRKKKLKQQFKMVNLLSSEMNTCQALVKPDCSKPKVMKSKGMQKALLSLLKDLECDSTDLIITNATVIPYVVARTTEICTVEFAGVKFKTKAATGTQYMKYIQNSILKKAIKDFPNIKRIVLCEEKYEFTPDNFKAETHKQRSASQKPSIGHLRMPDNLLNPSTFRKEDIVSTREGKSLISKYMAANISNIELDAEIVIDIDSELYTEGDCTHKGPCSCMPYAVPIRCTFKRGMKAEITKLCNICQRKGEAEMAQVDWLIQDSDQLQPSSSVCSLVTSGDIDAVPIHMYALSGCMQKSQDGTYKHPVHVILQKPQRKYDIYNITGILEIIERKFNSYPDIGKKIAAILCMGGNDFIPKYYGVSHEKMMKLFVKNNSFFENLFQLQEDGIYTVNSNIYKEFIKHLYCTKSMDPSQSFDDIRKLTIRSKKRKLDEGSLINVSSLRNAQQWLPPETALDRMVDLIDLQLKYLFTSGKPNATLPDFLQFDCLKKSESGDIEYYFGPDAKADTNEFNYPSKRKIDETPQKGRRKKKLITPTPKK